MDFESIVQIILIPVFTVILANGITFLKDKKNKYIKKDKLIYEQLLKKFPEDSAFIFHLKIDDLGGYIKTIIPDKIEELEIFLSNLP